MDQKELRWFGYVKRMDEYRMSIRVFMAEVEGEYWVGRGEDGWKDDVNVALANREMMMETA